MVGIPERGKRLLDNGYLFIRPRAKIAGKKMVVQEIHMVWEMVLSTHLGIYHGILIQNNSILND